MNESQNTEVKVKKLTELRQFKKASQHRRGASTASADVARGFVSQRLKFSDVTDRKCKLSVENIGKVNLLGTISVFLQFLRFLLPAVVSVQSKPTKVPRCTSGAVF